MSYPRKRKQPRTPAKPVEIKSEDSLGLFFDTETSGIPEYKIQSDDPVQPHIVQIAAILANLNTGEVVDTYTALVAPDGWEIPQGAIDVHGLSNEYCRQHGRPEKEVITEFIHFWRRADVRVAHNTTFDNRIVRIALKRFLTLAIADEWKEAPYFCTMVNGSKVIGGRWPKLDYALTWFTGEKLEGAHDALNDATACMKIFFAMQKKLNEGV